MEELASGKITKGMLSLIENNKAQPSMESLSHIAKQLGVNTADLLKEENKEELRSLVDKTEALYFLESYEDNHDSFQKYKDIVAHIEPLFEQIQHNSGYESARLLELYGYSLYFTGAENWKAPLEKADGIYNYLNISSRSASIGSFLSNIEFSKKNYHEALAVFLKEKEKIIRTGVYIEPLTYLNYNYNEAVFRLAVGEGNKAIEIIEAAVEYSKKHKIFYRIDELLSAAASYSLINRDKSKLEYYLDKLRQYGKLTNSRYYYAFSDLLTAEMMISSEGKYENALRLIEEYVDDAEIKIIEPYVYIVKGKALFGMERYRVAISWLEKAEVPDYFNHPYDLSLLYTGEIYKALCYLKLGNNEKALWHSTLALENYRDMPDSYYKQLAYTTQKRILEEIAL
ncbi:hypothetical protein G3A_15005 [Bacillus sp. 17376]|uniref:DNA-binding protein n=1 Tax=Mesobacillus boroniphilus JCM 21738 TaxID=1294265 RepID=W4RPK1_9BACI|nr:hypothetical protein G3A_15005 [Bacillus sp. 17376]GAE46251.1 DNA-binding protein [Mesobacillus boroniphilus JCM 21738]